MTALRNNQSHNVELTKPRLGPREEISGALTGDTLNIVSPSFKGPAFVPQNLASKEDVKNLIGTERQNIYGHLYDQLHYYVPNQGIQSLNMWFDNGGENAVHTRILGVGDGIINPETGKYTGAGFKLSENQGMEFIFSTYDSLTLSEDSSYIEELGLNVGKDHYFLTHVAFTPENVATEVPTNGAVIPSRTYLKFNKNGTLVDQSNQLYSSLAGKKPSLTVKDNLFVDQLRKSHYFYSKFNLKIQDKPIKINKLSGNNVYKSFEEKYQTAKTPWIVSQPIDRTGLSDNRVNIDESVINLFRFFSLDDGEVGNRFKIKINPKYRGDNNITEGDFSIFDLYIFEYDARVNEFTLLETYENLTLDINDQDYIGRRIGTKNTYFDITTQKIFTVGRYDNVSQYLRVEINEKIENNKVEKIQSIIPSGFRAYPHIDFTGLTGDSNMHANPVKYYRNFNDVSEIVGIKNTWGTQMYELENIEEDSNTQRAQPSLTNLDNITLQNQYQDYISPHYFHTKFFNKDIWIEDDKYLNNFFHLEKICYKNSISEGKYKDSGKNNSLPAGYKYLNLDEIEDFTSFSNYLSFDLFTYGGFDGNNILDFDKKYMTDKGLMISSYNQSDDSILNAYKLGIDQITKYENCNGTILALPDISTELLHQYCIEKVEGLTRYSYVGDIKNYHIDLSRSVDVTTESILNPSDYYNIDYRLSNYFKDEANIKTYSLDKTEDKMINIVNSAIYDTLDSKYFIPVLGDFRVAIGNVDERVNSYYISPVSFVLGLFSRSNSLKYNITGISPNMESELGVVSDFTFNDVLSLNLSGAIDNIDAEIVKETMYNLNINCFTKNAGLNNDAPGLLTAHTHTGTRFSINRKLNFIRTMQYIKNSLMIDLYTNTSIIPETVLFNNSSSLQNIYQKIKLQVTLLMQSLVSNGYITGFRVNIDDNYINNNFNDVLNHKLKGNIIIQFEESDIIELDLDNVLSELNEILASDNGIVELPRVI